MTGLPLLLLDAESRPFDRGLLVLLAALVFTAILAHRYWRRTIRLEDELETAKKDLTFHYGRYRRAWRTLRKPAALAERVTGLVTEATPGWEAAGFPAKGQTIHRGEADALAAWSAIPAPGADGSVSPAFSLSLGGRAFTATPLAEESLGLLLIEPE
ncbi:MAG TPA: hypothetical protein VFF76_10940 [Holophagaceae bacterium]|nr:hypothetical protein [Holophagaceae bacterium]